MAPYLLASPFISLVTAGCIAYVASWYDALLTIVISVLTVGASYFCAEASKRAKAKESYANDERMKLINNLVLGIRTIKLYAWENYFVKKIMRSR